MPEAKEISGRQKKSIFIRNFVFGVEDSLVSTAGLLSGIAASNVPRETILIAGFVLIAVEAFSMAVGSFLSEESAEEYVEGRDVSLKPPIEGGLVMFISYVVAGLVPLLPYVFFAGQRALIISITVSIIVLFILGIFNDKGKKRNIFLNGLKMGLLGGVVIAIGVMVGKFVNFI